MKFCGPKLSLCGIIISIWGIIQLVSFHQPNYCLFNTCDVFKQVLMGFFYYIRSVALIEDLNISEEHTFKNSQEFYSTADKMYSLVRINNTYITSSGVHKSLPPPGPIKSILDGQKEICNY